MMKKTYCGSAPSLHWPKAKAFTRSPRPARVEKKNAEVDRVEKERAEEERDGPFVLAGGAPGVDLPHPHSRGFRYSDFSPPPPDITICP